MSRAVAILAAIAGAAILIVLGAMGGQYERDHGSVQWPNSPEVRR